MFLTADLHKAFELCSVQGVSLEAQVRQRFAQTVYPKEKKRCLEGLKLWQTRPYIVYDQPFRTCKAATFLDALDLTLNFFFFPFFVCLEVFLIRKSELGKV